MSESPTMLTLAEVAGKLTGDQSVAIGDLVKAGVHAGIIPNTMSQALAQGFAGGLYRASGVEFVDTKGRRCVMNRACKSGVVSCEFKFRLCVKLG